MMGLQSFGSLDHVWEDSVGHPSSWTVNPNFITDDRKDLHGQIIATENTT